MTHLTDINEKIKIDFGGNASVAFEILEEALEKTEYLNHPRIIRCIIFLAEKNIETLKLNIQAAIIDPRDVMYWAEYINRELEKSPKRVRDFNNTFDQSEIYVKE